MKKISTLLFLVFTTCAFAQPTLNTVNVATVMGKSESIVAGDSLAQPGNAGANQVWDFSSAAVYAGSELVFTYKTPASATGGEYFTDANIAATTSANSTFSNITASSLEIKGVYNSTYYVTFSGDHSVKYPCTYNSTWTNNYTGYQDIYINSTTADVTGTRTILADGWGTLKTPFGVFANVIRLKSINHAVYNYDGYTADVKDTAYSWVINGGVQALMSISHSRTVFSIGSVIKTKVTSFGKTFVSGIDEVQQLPEINVFPNPATSEIFFSHADVPPGISIVKIYDVTGRMVKEINAAAQSKIDIGEMPAGYYFGVISDDKTGGAALQVREAVNK